MTVHKHHSSRQISTRSPCNTVVKHSRFWIQQLPAHQQHLLDLRLCDPTLRLEPISKPSRFCLPLLEGIAVLELSMKLAHLRILNRSYYLTNVRTIERTPLSEALQRTCDCRAAHLFAIAWYCARLLHSLVSASWAQICGFLQRL